MRWDHYTDFEQFRDYASLDQMPAGEYVNAVRVTFTQNDTALTGMNPQVDLTIQSLAYLQRIDMAALDPLGYIRLGHNSEWTNTRFFSNGLIQYPESTSATGAVYHSPVFDACELLAVKEVVSCPVTVTPLFPVGSRLEILWNDGSVQTAAPIRAGLSTLAICSTRGQ